MNVRNIISVVSILTFASLAQAAAPQSHQVDMMNAKGESVGTAVISPMAKGVKIELTVHGLTPGVHAFHVHTNGKCEAPSFESAGGHFAPFKHEHGFNSMKGYHAGDMANIFVNADGTAHVEVINTQVTLGHGRNSLLKKGGTSLVIHAKADDYKSQPSGDAGSRVACGVVK